MGLFQCFFYHLRFWCKYVKNCLIIWHWKRLVFVFGNVAIRYMCAK